MSRETGMKCWDKEQITRKIEGYGPISENEEVIVKAQIGKVLKMELTYVLGSF